MTSTYTYTRSVPIDTQAMREARGGETYKDLAARIGGVTGARLGQIENGKGRPSPGLAQAIANALGITLDQLKAKP